MGDLLLGYGSITSSKNSKTLDLTGTKAYKDAYRLIKECFLAAEDIKIDILSHYKKNREHPELDKFIEKVCNSHKRGCVVVRDIQAFGTLEEIRKYYDILLYHNIGLLIIDHTYSTSIHPYSTADFSLNMYSSIEEVEKAASCFFDDYENNRIVLKEKTGRMGKDISEDFITAYWKYEKYEISGEEAYKQAGVFKATFRRLCEQYEDFRNFKTRFSYELRFKEEVEKDPLLPFKPKRFGNVPEYMISIFEALDEECPDFTNAYKNMENKEYTFEEFTRFYYKAIHPRSNMLKATYSKGNIEKPNYK